MFKTTLCIAAVLAAFTTAPVAAAEFKQIKTNEEFMSLVAGKKLWFGKDHVTARKNGQLIGNFSGERLKGAWEWRGSYWCRTLTTHAKNTDCQTWETDGTSFRITRSKGKGKSFVYTTK